MTKGIVYYTSNQLDPKILEVCKKQLSLSPVKDIVSVSLKPIDLGRNLVIVLSLNPGYMTILRQILAGLTYIQSDIVYFAEHDVLYHPSHFEFIPPRPDIFYYNVNVWRWDYPKDRAITYDFIRSQSGLCAYRELLINHYTARIKMIEENHWHTKESDQDPRYARIMGYEPGTKGRHRGGVFPEAADNWRSPCPNIDIRHDHNFSLRKVDLSSFKHKPDKSSWQEITINQIPGWDKVRERFI